ncbi:tetratricopeptide repeat protein [Myxococcus sp. RHSTA-1-4]|uniref:tetratricopeptide repeat protein n=1 Tax=Myxococcus sp. RHSTA-1-4 TaxID=2874601 RepID=UPI001CBFD9E9|nr:tetratricopeptide repeat protein [Myxococcus sp. RHSTA-1-4]
MLARLLRADEPSIYVHVPWEDVADEALPPPPLREGLGTAHLEVSTREPLAQAYFDQGLRLLHLGWGEEARRAFAEAARRDSGLAMAWWGLALARGAGARFAGARAEATRRALALSEGATDVEQRYVVAASLLADKGPANGRHAFVRDMECLIDRYPEDAEARLLLAGFLLDGYEPDGRPGQGQPYAQALLRELLRTHPDHAGVHCAWVHAMLHSARPEAALESARKLVRLAPAASPALLAAGRLLHRVGKVDEARRALEAAVAADDAWLAGEHLPHTAAPSAETAMRLLSQGCAEAGQYTEAQAWARRLRHRVEEAGRESQALLVHRRAEAVRDTEALSGFLPQHRVDGAGSEPQALLGQGRAEPGQHTDIPSSAHRSRDLVEGAGNQSQVLLGQHAGLRPPHRVDGAGSEPQALLGQGRAEPGQHTDLRPSHRGESAGSEPQALLFAAITMVSTHLRFGFWRAAADVPMELPESAPLAVRALRDGVRLYTRGVSALEAGKLMEVERACDALDALHPPLSEERRSEGRLLCPRDVARVVEVAAQELRGSLEARRGDAGRAEATLTRAVRLERRLRAAGPAPFSRSPREALARLRLRSEREDRALSLARTLVSERPGCGHFRLLAAEAQVALGAWDDAVADFTAFLDCWRDADPHLPELRRARTFIAGRGRVLRLVHSSDVPTPLEAGAPAFRVLETVSC